MSGICGAAQTRRTAGALDEQKAAKAPKVAPTAESVDWQWRHYCVIEVMIRNPAVESFVREKEREIEGLWARIRTMASQSDPSWAMRLAKQCIAEREA